MNRPAPPPRKVPLVSYTLVTMNRRDELVDCLLSIRRQNYPNKEILVVDNASSDDTVECIERDFPEVRLIRCGRNIGAAAGRNRAIEHANGEFCLLIDDDAALMDPDATRLVVDHFKRDPRLAVIAFAVRLASTDRLDRQAVPRTDKKPPATDAACTYFCGAGAALRRAAFLEVGPFWEVLFYGGEEIDLSYRLLDRGYRILYCPSIRVSHRRSPISRPSGRWTYVATRNRCWVAVKNLPWHYAASTTALWWGYVVLRCIRDGQFRAFGRGVIDATRGLSGVLAERHPVRPETINELRKLSGRLWY